MTRGRGQRPLVLILGAGLSGLALAALLDPERVDVLVLEQDFPPGRSRQFHGVVRAADLRELSLDTQQLRLHQVHQVVSAGTARPVTVDEWWSIEHRDLLDALRARAESRGVRVVSNQAEVDLVWRQGELAGVGTRPGGLMFESDVVVFADESDPRLPEQVGLRPDWLPTDLMHLAKVRFEGRGTRPADILSLTGTASWGSTAYCLVVPGADAVTVKVAMLLEDAMATARHIGEYLDEALALPSVQAIVAGLERGSMITEVVPIGGLDRAHRFQRGRAMVASDLLGVTHPLNRDGFSTTLAYCRIAADAIHSAAGSGVLRPGLLGPYSGRIEQAFPRAVRTRRRREQAPASIPAWQWFTLPELVPPPGVTPSSNSAKLPARPVAVIRQRLGALTGSRRTR